MKVQTDFTKLLLDFKSIPRHKRKMTFMEISGYPHYENVCSNILRFYLNPTHEHELKDLVLNSLLHLIDKDFQFDIDFEKIEIFRELKTIDNNRIDLVILTENYAIGIENKIFHHLHNDLTDYQNTIKSLCNNSRKPVCIVLSLNKLTLSDDIKKVNANSFVNVTYEQFFHNIKQSIGAHMTSSNISYINHLTDFIKSIENLTPKTMENKALWTFFKNNSETVQELMNSFSEYKESLYQKIDQLNATLPQSKFAPTVDQQWIYKESCLVHDYTILSRYKVAVDTYIDISGWEIQIFGRDSESTKFLFNYMSKDNNFFEQPHEGHVRGERLIYGKFDTDTDISIVAKRLANLLTKIENYKSLKNETANSQLQ